MIKIGRLCIKIAGRDARGKCIIADILDDNYVLIDGNVRRKKCNIKHLEPLKDVIKIKKGASHEEVVEEFRKLKIPVWNKKSKPKTERPRKQRKKKEKIIKEEKTDMKKGSKKVEKKK